MTAEGEMTDDEVRGWLTDEPLLAGVNGGRCLGWGSFPGRCIVIADE